MTENKNNAIVDISAMQAMRLAMDAFPHNQLHIDNVGELKNSLDQLQAVIDAAKELTGRCEWAKNQLVALATMQNTKRSPNIQVGDMVAINPMIIAQNSLERHLEITAEIGLGPTYTVVKVVDHLETRRRYISIEGSNRRFPVEEFVKI